MNPRSILSFLPLILFVAGTYAQTGTIVYVEGDVQIGSEGVYSTAWIGRSISENDTIRVPAEAYVEISTTGNAIRLTKPGDYGVADLLDSSNGPTGTAGALTARFMRFTGTQAAPRTTSTAAGVRADEAETEPEVAWAGAGDTDTLIQEGLDLLNQGALVEASYRFEEAYLFGTAESSAQAAFLYGYSLYLSGEPQAALDLFQESPPDPQSDWFIDALLAQAEIALAVEQADVAADAAGTAISQLCGSDDTATLQIAYHLLGRSYRLLGNSEAAASAFETAHQLAPQTEIGRLSDEQ